MRPFLERVRSGETLVGDGATGTRLMERVLRPGESPEAATLAHRDAVLEIVRAYVEAGADVVETNTFGGTPLKLALAGLDADAERLNREAVRIAREAAGDRAYVAASVGPTGKLLEPYGDTASDVVAAAFRAQLGWLHAEGVDLVIVETMVDLTEAVLGVRAAQEVEPSVPVAALMTFDPTPRGFFTVMGVSPAAAAATLGEAGAALVGANCGNGVAQMVELARDFRRHTDVPLVIQPNAGLPVTRDGRVVYEESPEEFAAGARDLLALGVSVIGGCCGTTPEHVAAVRKAVRR